MMFKRKRPEGYEDLARRIGVLEKRLDKKLELHESLEQFYIDLIHDCAEREANVAVAKMLENPIEMTIEDIEKAFGHKVKIVQK